MLRRPSQHHVKVSRSVRIDAYVYIHGGVRNIRIDMTMRRVSDTQYKKNPVDKMNTFFTSPSWGAPLP